MTRHIALFLASLLIPFAALAATDPSPEIPAPAAQPARLFQLSYEDAEEAIAQALVEQGVADKISVTIVGRRGNVMFSYDRPVSVEIRGLTYDKPTRRWSASLLAVSGSDVLTARPISGRYEEMVQIPVLKRQVRNGEVIREEDIDMQKVPLARTRPGTVMTAETLVGQTPEHSISANRPVRDQEISRPAIIRKDAIVQIRYSSPGMEISTTGQALDDGAKGRMVSVRNLSSKKVIHAVVESANVVRVMTVQPAQAQATTTEENHATN